MAACGSNESRGRSLATFLIALNMRSIDTVGGALGAMSPCANLRGGALHASANIAHSTSRPARLVRPVLMLMVTSLPNHSNACDARNQKSKSPNRLPVYQSASKRPGPRCFNTGGGRVAWYRILKLRNPGRELREPRVAHYCAGAGAGAAALGGRFFIFASIFGSILRIASS